MVRKTIMDRQRGVTLVEVMVAVLVAAVGVLGAAAMQLSALKYTDSSRMTSQASFIVYDVIDRIRANAAAGVLDNYAMSSVAAAPGSASSVLDQDKIDFANNVSELLTDGAGSITVNQSQVTVEVSWSEGRAGGNDDAGQAQRGAFSVTTQVKPMSTSAAGGAGTP
jgi:type IV pilus assembly protein PilV